MNKPERFRPPSVDTVLRSPGGELAIARHGRAATTEAVRRVLEQLRGGGQPLAPSPEEIGRTVLDWLEERGRPSQRPVINLTGTVLHTNLGRALLAEEAIEAVVTAMRAPTNLEYAIETGQRGERDAHLRELIREQKKTNEILIAEARRVRLRDGYKPDDDLSASR